MTYLLCKTSDIEDPGSKSFDVKIKQVKMANWFQVVEEGDEDLDLSRVCPIFRVNGKNQYVIFDHFMIDNCSFLSEQYSYKI